MPEEPSVQQPAAEPSATTVSDVATQQPSNDDLRAEIEVLRKETGALKAANTKAAQETALHAALAKGNFVNPAQAAQLLREQAAQTDYSAASLENVVMQFVTDPHNFYLVRSDLPGGAGSTPSQGVGARQERIDVGLIFGSDSNGTLANKLYRTNKFEYQRLKKVAQERGLI